MLNSYFVADTQSYCLTSDVRLGSRTVMDAVLKSTRKGINTVHFGQLVKTTQDTCKACQSASRYASARLRLPLGEVSVNTAKPRAPRSALKCSQCDINLCSSGLCWQDHLDAYNNAN